MPIPANKKRPRHDQGDGDFEVVPFNSATRTATISIALPSSFVANAQSPELRMYVAGQVARAAAIFRIDEIVIFEETSEQQQETGFGNSRRRRRVDESFDATEFFKVILEYLETPQYLRKKLFPVSEDLRFVGLLNPLALPSHVAREDCCRWREGIAVGRTNYSNYRGNRGSRGAKGIDASAGGPPTRFIDVGVERLVEIDTNVQVGDRVTVDMEPAGEDYGACPGKYLFGRLADRDVPRRTDGTYWGYRVRVASSLSKVFSNSIVAPKGYDLAVGTSERGTPIVGNPGTAVHFDLPNFSNLLIVFGGVHGLEKSVQGDQHLEQLGIKCVQDDQQNTKEEGHNVADLFDYYINTCPHQGSRTIRTEEALLISLAAIQPYLHPSD